jgi:membrane protein YdbS with pleckstrin-like domain
MQERELGQPGRDVTTRFSQEAGQVIEFQGSPNWAINLPFFLKCGCAAALSMWTAFGTAGLASSLPLVASLAALVAVAGSVALRAATTAYTEIVIDSVRLTYRTGILTRRVASVEMYRVQNVECVSEWWERLFGFGTLVVESSDVNHPRWILRGMNNVESLREWINQAAIARRDAKGIREVNMGRV